MEILFIHVGNNVLIPLFVEKRDLSNERVANYANLGLFYILNVLNCSLQK